MDDPQWCLDECPTCSTVVHGRAIYCSPECEPEVDPEPELEHDGPWTHCSSIRVSAWALDCYKATLAPTSSPAIFPSPSQRKLHIQKKHPTLWVTSDPSFHSTPHISSSISTSTAVESLVTNSTPSRSPISRWSAQSWSCSSPGPLTPPLLTKTNVYLCSDPLKLAHQPANKESSNLPAAEKAQHGRSSHPMLKQHRREDRLCPPTTHGLLRPPPVY
ncbi:hypothetical protein DFH08DRAFT_931995 [Mycena albidolilacea]|uniref:Uncharacterized protein n=1 Tax=Mycena albidolilacea TaxID=1033008 RepID=A0AAD7AI97_9AGAR|nr:hypothetical protein DFH08DRAFT_931995 [Mycena albidolilacea]